MKKLFLKILQYLQENTCWSLSLMKLQAFLPGTLLKILRKPKEHFRMAAPAFLERLF